MCGDALLRAHSAPRLAKAAPVQEVLQAPQQYDGKAADVWSCGVHLYIMLVGWYPFTDPRDPKNFPKTAQCINDGHFTYPPDLQLSDACQQLIRRMLEKDPRQRITIAEVQHDPWFLKNLSRELMVCSLCYACCADGLVCDAFDMLTLAHVRACVRVCVWNLELCWF